MFEKYSEKARRTIFFARYEAATWGSPYIETEHLLLGLLREERSLLEPLRIGSAEAFRNQVEARLGPPREKVSTSLDLPLSQECKRALAYAAEDAEAFGHPTIECLHLILGLLRVEKCGAAELLRQNGIEYTAFREAAAKMPPPASRPSASLLSRLGALWPPRPEPEPSKREPPKPAAPSLQMPLVRLSLLVTGAEPHLKAFSDSDGDVRLKRKDWSRKEAIGHLIDWATTHHQWIAQAMTQPKLAASLYPLDEWVTAQQYRTMAWRDLVELWVRLNRLLLHTLSQVSEEKLGESCRVGIEDSTTLLKLIERYVEHCEDMAAQILVRT